jgi:transposase
VPAERTPMRKIREILRLRLGLQLSRRNVGRSCNVSPSTVAEVEYRATAAGLRWPVELDDAALEAKLYPPPVPMDARPAPDFAAVLRELKRPGVTLQLWWQEYRQAHPDGYGYSHFCELYQQWRQRLDVVLRQEHQAGEKLFVDFAGATIPVHDPHGGPVRQVSLFVGVLGARA